MPILIIRKKQRRKERYHQLIINAVHVFSVKLSKTVMFTLPYYHVKNIINAVHVFFR